MIHLAGAYLLSAVLIGIGVTGVLIRRNAVLVLIGIELILAGALVLTVTAGARGASHAVGSVLPLFVMTIAAAEVVVALAVILTAYRHHRTIDLDATTTEGPE